MFIDIQPTIIDDVINSSKENDVTNFVRGHFMVGKEIVDPWLDQVKKVATNCIMLQGIFVLKLATKKYVLDAVWKVLHAGGIFVCLNTSSSDYDCLYIMNGVLPTKEFKKALVVGANASMNG
ncbi:hypothetical protein V6N13_138012 [Hibiscus sabdariffa]